MKKKSGSFLAAMVVFAFFGIGVTPFAGADGTQLTPYGVQFPDGTRQSTAARKWTRLLLVSPKSTPALSGTALKDALDAIRDASSDKPYLLMLEPGEYYLASYPLLMKPYVDIQGSGENVTAITGVVANEYSGVVQGADNAELRFVTVENKGGFGYNANAIYNYKASPSLLHVSIEASGGTVNRGIYNREARPTITHVDIVVYGGLESYGIHNKDQSKPTMTHVTIEAASATSNYGVYNSYSSPTMDHVIIEGAGDSSTSGYGIYNENSYSVDVNHSVIDGTNNSIACISGSVFVGSTQLKGGPVSGSVTCAGVYDESYSFFPSSCP
jgi:hypothetical protein